VTSSFARIEERVGGKGELLLHSIAGSKAGGREKNPGEGTRNKEEEKHQSEVSLGKKNKRTQGPFAMEGQKYQGSIRGEERKR